MSKLSKELIRGLKWVLISIFLVIIMIASWIGFAWAIGWFTQRFYDLSNFGPSNYISFGSSILVFTFVIQIITIILTLWALLSWGKARGIYGKNKIK